MKLLITFVLILITLISCGQSKYQDWDNQAKTNIRLLPNYGNIEKSKEQKEMDNTFIEETMKIEKFNANRILASDYMINVGFQYLYKGDLKTAMYRFNQAFLLDNENTDIYWGFGAIYMSLLNLDKAKEQYEEGLKLNPKNTHLLTDYGTYFLTKYNEAKRAKNKNAKEYLDNATEQLLNSYHFDPKDQNTLYKLSVCYFINQDCKNAKKFYNLCKDEGGNPITEEYTLE